MGPSAVFDHLGLKSNSHAYSDTGYLPKTVEVFKSKSHTYRHDLESLFYVFLWAIVGRSLDISWVMRFLNVSFHISNKYQNGLYIDQYYEFFMQSVFYEMVFWLSMSTGWEF